MGSTASERRKETYQVVEHEGFLLIDLQTREFTKELGETLIREIQERQVSKLILDCSAVDYVFSMGLGAMIRLDRELRMKGGKLRLCALKPELRELFAITRIDRVVQICESCEAIDTDW